LGFPWGNSGLFQRIFGRRPFLTERGHFLSFLSKIWKKGGSHIFPPQNQFSGGVQKDWEWPSREFWAPKGVTLRDVEQQPGDFGGLNLFISPKGGGPSKTQISLFWGGRKGAHKPRGGASPGEYIYFLLGQNFPPVWRWCNTFKGGCETQEGGPPYQKKRGGAFFGGRTFLRGVCFKPPRIFSFLRVGERSSPPSSICFETTDNLFFWKTHGAPYIWGQMQSTKNPLLGGRRHL